MLRKNWRKLFLPLWALWSVVLLTAATPQQTILEDIPWWVWLIVISVILLIMFGLVLAVDLRSTGDNEQDKTS